jgi:hypothetical protein
VKFASKFNAECIPCKNTPHGLLHPLNVREIPIFQGYLRPPAEASGDVWKRNDSATRRAETGKIRGMCSASVQVGAA